MSRFVQLLEPKPVEIIKDVLTKDQIYQKTNENRPSYILEKIRPIVEQLNNFFNILALEFPIIGNKELKRIFKIPSYTKDLYITQFNNIVIDFYNMENSPPQQNKTFTLQQSWFIPKLNNLLKILITILSEPTFIVTPQDDLEEFGAILSADLNDYTESDQKPDRIKYVTEYNNIASKRDDYINTINDIKRILDIKLYGYVDDNNKDLRMGGYKYLPPFTSPRNPLLDDDLPDIITESGSFGWSFYTESDIKQIVEYLQDTVPMEIGSGNGLLGRLLYEHDIKLILTDIIDTEKSDEVGTQLIYMQSHKLNNLEALITYMILSDKPVDTLIVGWAPREGYMLCHIMKFIFKEELFVTTLLQINDIILQLRNNDITIDMIKDYMRNNNNKQLKFIDNYDISLILFCYTNNDNLLQMITDNMDKIKTFFKDANINFKKFIYMGMGSSKSYWEDGTINREKFNTFKEIEDIFDTDLVGGYYDYIEYFDNKMTLENKLINTRNTIAFYTIKETETELLGGNNNYYYKYTKYIEKINKKY